MGGGGKGCCSFVNLDPFPIHTLPDLQSNVLAASFSKCLDFLLCNDTWYIFKLEVSFKTFSFKIAFAEVFYFSNRKTDVYCSPRDGE